MPTAPCSRHRSSWLNRWVRKRSFISGLQAGLLPRAGERASAFPSANISASYSTGPRPAGSTRSPKRLCHIRDDIWSSCSARVVDLKTRVWFWCGVVVVALALTGHRLTLTQPSPKRLRFAHTFTTESERAILDAAVAEFEQSHPDVRNQQIISNSEVYNTVSWRLQFQGRNRPDIYFHWQGFKVESCIERGWAMDLTRLLAPGFAEQFVAAALRKRRDGIYFLPQSIDISNLIWYDRDSFVRLNLREPRSLEEWLKLCRSIRQAGILPLAQGNRDLWPMGNLGAELLGQSLGADAANRLFQPGTPIHSGDLGGLETFNFLLQNRCFDLPGVLERGALGSLGDIDAKVLFLSGRSAQHILGSWFVADIADARQKNELKYSV